MRLPLSPRPFLTPSGLQEGEPEGAHLSNFPRSTRIANAHARPSAKFRRRIPILVEGSERSPETSESEILGALSPLDALAEHAGLPETSKSGLAKARRVVGALVEPLRFVHHQTKARLAALGLAASVHTDVVQRMVPGLYLESAARRAPTAEQRRELSIRSLDLLAPLRTSDHPLELVPEHERCEIWQVARGCAGSVSGCMSSGVDTIQ